MAERDGIKALRWRVILATRAQVPTPDGGLAEPWRDLMAVHAHIEALRPTAYWDSQQTDTPVSHMIRIRWVNVLDNTQVIKRVSLLPNGQARTEIYRVRRYKEVNGRKRFVDIEAQLEAVA